MYAFKCFYVNPSNGTMDCSLYNEEIEHDENLPLVMDGMEHFMLEFDENCIDMTEIDIYTMAMHDAFANCKENGWEFCSLELAYC